MHAQKLVAGALLTGMTVATGNATLIATAGAVGVNWLSEGLAGLWPSLLRRGAGPLEAAYAAAIRQGTAQLQAEYTRTVAPHSDPAAFALVAACAGAVAAAEFPAGAAAEGAAQRALDAALAALLYGHDERQAAFLRTRLLPACAVTFQQQLVADETAWRAFHGLLLQALAANVAALTPRLDRFADVLAAFSDPAAGVQALQQGMARLEASSARIETTTGATFDAVQRVEQKVDDLARKPSPGGVTFDNQDMEVKGNIYQGKTHYFGSAHAESGGVATVVNTIGTPPAPAASSAPAAPARILLLAANPVDTERLRLDAEARAIDAALRQDGAGARYELRQQWAVHSGDLVDALLRHRPVVVHFAGHGADDGRLVVEDGAGHAALLSPAGVAALFAAVPGVRCVVLNACWSDVQAEALLAHVECVVGMADEVLDDAAVAFAGGFYRGMAAGEAVATAVALGKAQIHFALDDPDTAAAQAALVRMSA
ncbi:MAG: CHAT domain-containing protein [Caldilinea sp.]